MKGLLPRDAHMVEQLAEWRQGVRRLGGDHHKPHPSETESEHDSVFYFKEPESMYIGDLALFDEKQVGSIGHIMKTLRELGYVAEVAELFDDCKDAFSLGLSVSEILDIALDRFYVLDQGAYEKYADHVVGPITAPQRETQLIEFPHGFLQRVA